MVSSAYSVHQALENCPQNALGFGSDRRWFGNPELHYQCFQAYTSCCAARGSEPLLEHMAERCERSTMDAMAYVLDGRAGTEPTLPHVAPAYVSRLVSPYWRRCRKTPPSILCLDDLMIPCPFKTRIRAFSYKSHSGIQADKFQGIRSPLVLFWVRTMMLQLPISHTSYQLLRLTRVLPNQSKWFSPSCLPSLPRRHCVSQSQLHT